LLLLELELPAQVLLICPRSRTAAVVGDARALRRGFTGEGGGAVVGHEHALLAVAGEGDTANPEGRVVGDGVLVHDPPDAAASHVQVEVVPDPPDVLTADEQHVAAVVLFLADAPLAPPCPAAVAAAAAGVCVSLGLLLADVEEGAAVRGRHPTPLPHQGQVAQQGVGGGGGHHIVLVGLRDYQHDKADVILRYRADEARLLKAYGEIPDTVGLNEEHDVAEYDIETTTCSSGTRTSSTRFDVPCICFYAAAVLYDP
jgi:hypothetical protein